MILMRIGRREHLEQIRTDGLLYMNTLQFFTNLENRAQQDRFEGSTEIIQPQDAGIIRLGAVTFEPADIAGPIIRGSARCNIFCFYAIYKPTDLFPIDERILEFGDSYILFTNTLEFIKRFSAAAQKAGFPFEGRLVTYFDATLHSGDTGPFMKPLEFAYQNEYRLAIQTGRRGAFQLRLGDLTDITTPILRSADMRKKIDFTEQKARAAGFTWEGMSTGKPGGG